MGWGDTLMACGEAKEIYQRTGKKVKIGDKRTLFREPEIFANNPYVCQSINEDGIWLANYPTKRPYIAGSKNGHMLFNDYKPIPGELFFTKEELAWADEVCPKEDFILIEPTVKDTYIHTVNKAWHYWGELVRHDYPFYQVGRDESKAITSFIKTKTFRQAMLVLNKAKLFIGTDGGLHHAAAALNVPAIVIWTGFTSPKHLGYDQHLNIHDGGEPCGTFSKVCEHCLEISKSITVERVLDAINTKWCRT